MNQKEQKVLDQYLLEASAFNQSENNAKTKSERTAWRVAKAFGFFLLLALLALMGLTPLKQTVTEVLVLDKSTGTMQPLQSLKEVQLTLDEVFHKSNLNTFVLARENYTNETAEKNYYTAAAFMSTELQTEWANLWKMENPSNPFNLYKKAGKVHIEVASIVLNPKQSGKLEVATIRFKKTIERAGTSLDGERYWTATVTYRLVSEPKEEKERLVNPLGFQVTHYQVDPETASRPLAPAAATPTAAPATVAQ